MALYIEQPLILEWCLLSLGLIIAIYTLVFPQIKNILKNNINDIVRLEKEMEIKSRELSEDTHSVERKKKATEIGDISDKLDSLYELPYDLYAGFIVCMILFSIPLIIYALDSVNITITPGIIKSVIPIFFLGVLSFVILFILIFVRLNSLVREEFDASIIFMKNEKERLNDAIKKISNKKIRKKKSK